ncbi:MAG: NAD(P)(+) transhydrogenase (Re/Si-specific) subunit beta, partial [Gemmatimonadetes bacterium]|nr:NAD(P)(+) transhydrogenase (Re/Si-specific) subunit beta [Gemmatimonadota bacterium]
MDSPVTLLSVIVQLGYLVSAVLFIYGLKQLSSPATARGGNALAALGMLLAIVLTLVDQGVLNWPMILTGLFIGSLIGMLSARLVKMTAMPQMVGLFNGFGGGASTLVAYAEFLRLQAAGAVPQTEIVTIVLTLLIGAVTFSGSMVAFAKLQELMTGAPITYPLQKTANLLLFLVVL